MGNSVGDGVGDIVGDSVSEGVGSFDGGEVTIALTGLVLGVRVLQMSSYRQVDVPKTFWQHSWRES